LSSEGDFFFNNSLIFLDSDKKLGVEKFLVGSSVLKSRDFAGEIIILIT
jgi:hypothetical protein